MTLALLALATITFTLPSTGQRVWTNPSQGEDSLMVECSGGAAIHELRTVRRYWNPVGGGGWRLAEEKDVRGKEGQTDSLTFDPGQGGHLYLTATNTVGESCASSQVYVSGSITTGVPDSGAGDPITSSRHFDVQGRLVLEIEKSGIYFRRDVRASGLVTTKKVLVLK